MVSDVLVQSSPLAGGRSWCGGSVLQVLGEGDATRALLVWFSPCPFLVLGDEVDGLVGWAKIGFGVGFPGWSARLE